MVDRSAPRAWLMLAVGDTREYAGHDGYDDTPDSHYSWDSRVSNHALPQRGDVIALRDKNVLLGAGVIETIEHGTANKPVHSCPQCSHASIKARSVKKPKYRCGNCKSEFDNATTEVKPVQTYRSRHQASWEDHYGVLDRRQLSEVCKSEKTQHSLRELKYVEFQAALQEAGSPLSVVEATLTGMLHGHLSAVARVRRGQRDFRNYLLKQYGSVCAVTGPAPTDVLEAAHLYRYADEGKHHQHGGLLLRRDIHVLFDRGHLAVHPERLVVDLRPEFRAFADYGRLHGKPLATKVHGKQLTWLDEHWTTHRRPVKDGLAP